MRVKSLLDLSDPQDTRIIALAWRKYERALQRRGIVNSKKGWAYRDEVEPYGPIPSGIVYLKKGQKG